MTDSRPVEQSADESMSPEVRTALKKLLYRMADDDLIIAHRNSEWTGLGPTLEEDIAFSSIAQDKLGHALGLYTILHEELGEENPDTIAFGRTETTFTCCHFVELPIGDYAFSLVRHLLFDLADQIRFELLETSSFEPLARLARKVKGEIKYHLFHGAIWVKKLAAEGNEESRARIHTAVRESMPLALGIFEPVEEDQVLIEAGIFPGEEHLCSLWLKGVEAIFEDAGIPMPDTSELSPATGGREGNHTEYLAPLLSEMTEVFRIDPSAEW